MSAASGNRSPDVTPPPMPRWAVRVASVAIVLHLAAVIAAPLAVPPTSPLLLRARETLAPYIDAVYLNHGYHFFAPDPGPSHLVLYELELADGQKRMGTFPDRTVHRPRLFYHRHFMLSEKLPPPQTPQERKVYDAVVRSYADHLLSEHPEAVAVELTYREHLIAPPLDVQKGRKLDDPSLYVNRKLGRFTRTAGKAL